MLTDIPDIQTSKTIPESKWLTEKEAHEDRVDELLNDYLAARSRQEKNPVMDFLFEYYAFRPSNLRKWSPGIGVNLPFSDFDKLPEISEITTNDGIAFVDPHLFPEKRISSLKWMLTMLKNTQQSRPSFGCFGMHEWAMVYKTDRPRHDQLPMRMEPDELAEFVESRPLLCTHFDAFRFFTNPAKPMNKFELSRETFHETEQPGCIHSNMDLYKWAFKMHPWIPSSLILEAFELAIEARYIDMQASPYDMREQGMEPIKIETDSGRREYKQKQEMIFEKSLPIRARIIEHMQNLLTRVEE
ncbi:3-methyladenine DNA glycosylase [Gracilimonas amylolytica]|uniref:3-methyladenine DNA glycosylase n=1 Tax=Gracilimonas amylolytica TaxID=1749045 RepID=UPI000CD85F7C|nr:3-methyladenine DNA glycosylase [Gracilimonas amylolytica]